MPLLAASIAHACSRRAALICIASQKPLLWAVCSLRCPNDATCLAQSLKVLALYTTCLQNSALLLSAELQNSVPQASQPLHAPSRCSDSLLTLQNVCIHSYRIINGLVDFRYEAARVAEVKRRFLRLNRCIPLEGFLTGWFLGAPVESIRRGNVEDFVAYGFYSRYMHELPPHVSTRNRLPNS